MEEELLTMGGFAAKCGISTRTVNRWRNMMFWQAPRRLCKSARLRMTNLLAWTTERKGCDCRTTGWALPAPAAGCHANGGA